jgi:hypothetical protein
MYLDLFVDASQAGDLTLYLVAHDHGTPSITGATFVLDGGLLYFDPVLNDEYGPEVKDSKPCPYLEDGTMSPEYHRVQQRIAEAIRDFGLNRSQFDFTPQLTCIMVGTVPGAAERSVLAVKGLGIYYGDSRATVTGPTPTAAPR